MPCGSRQFFTIKLALRTSFLARRDMSPHLATSSKRYLSNIIVQSPFPSLTVPDTTINELIWKDVHKWGNRTAIICAESGKSYTYNRLRKLCRRFSISLRKNNFQKGQVLSVILPNMPEYPIVLLGSAEAGLIVTTFNPNFTAEEISRQLENSQSNITITLASLSSKVTEAKKLIEARTKKSYKLTLITIQDVPRSENDIDFNEMIDETYDNVTIPEAEICTDDVALLPFSSGTTGFSKGVQLTHSNIVNNLHQVGGDGVNYLEETTDTYQEVIPAVIPFFHIFGIMSIMLQSFLYGGKIITLSKFDPVKYLNILQDEKPTILYLVPTLAYFLTSHPSVNTQHLNNVKISFFAGGNTPVSEMEKLVRTGGNKMKVRHAYGLTETSPCVSMSLDNDPYCSVGKPVANTAIKIVGPDGSILSSYQRGEICVKGPQVMKGYLNNQKATEEVIDRDQFFHTGDTGYYDDDGRIFYVDRMKELIKVKGFQVPPAELESILKSHNGVNDVGVIGIPDKRCGEKPIAFVVPKKLREFSESDLKTFVATKVAPYKQLADVVFVESIPRNPSGKILRRILKENYGNLTRI